MMNRASVGEYGANTCPMAASNGIKGSPSLEVCIAFVGNIGGASFWTDNG